MISRLYWLAASRIQFLRAARDTFLVVCIGAASTTALSGEHCWPRPAPESERMTPAALACGGLGAATDRRAKEVASLSLLHLEPGFWTQMALETAAAILPRGGSAKRLSLLLYHPCGATGFTRAPIAAAAHLIPDVSTPVAPDDEPPASRQFVNTQTLILPAPASWALAASGYSAATPSTSGLLGSSAWAVAYEWLQAHAARLH